MNYIYSATKNSFYPINMEDSYRSSGTWPLDGVEVEDSVFNEFALNLNPDKMRVAGKDGLPSWADIPPPTQEQIIAELEAEKQSRIAYANDHINSNQWPGKAVLGRLSKREKDDYNSWLDYLDELTALIITSPATINWPDMPS